MLHTIWDWWFGDGPLGRWLHTRWTRRGWPKARRQWVFILATGGWTAMTLSPEAGLQPCWADGPSGPAAPAFSTVVFRMLQQDGQPEQLDPPSASRPATTGPSEEPSAEERLRRLLEEDGTTESDNQDAARRQRLRELLQRSRDEAAAPRKDRRSDRERPEVRRGETDDDQFAEPFIENRLPQVEDQTLMLPPLRAVSIATEPIGNGRLPEDFIAEEALAIVPLPEDARARGFVGAGTWLPWAAPNTFSHPLYFEDRMLERHGHERWGCLQPIAAGARFFTTVPMLPYLTTIQEPCSIVYSKGYLRAGSPVPRFFQRPPLERRAVVVEAAAVSGAFLALP